MAKGKYPATWTPPGKNNIRDYQGPGPRIAGSIMVDTSRGEWRVRKWPKKRPGKRHPKSVYWSAWMAAGNRMFRRIHWSEQWNYLKYTKNTQLMPRDLFFMMKRGTLALIQLPDGKVMVPRWAWERMTESLDAFSQEVGAILVRTPDGWGGLVPAEEGEVLTSGGPGEIPNWQPQGSIAGDVGAILILTQEGLEALAPGPEGHILTTQGEDEVPQWTNPEVLGGGAGFGTTIYEVELESDTATLDTGPIDPSYTHYFFEWWKPSGVGAYLTVHFNESDEDYYRQLHSAHASGGSDTRYGNGAGGFYLHYNETQVLDAYGYGRIFQRGATPAIVHFHASESHGAVGNRERTTSGSAHWDRDEKISSIQFRHWDDSDLPAGLWIKITAY